MADYHAIERQPKSKVISGASRQSAGERNFGFFTPPLSCPAWDEGRHLKFPIISSNGFATSFEGEEQRFSSSQCLA
jgi:hypothetical protein